jgi:hypothetical protein
MMKVVSAIIILFVGLLSARGQQTETSDLSDVDKSAIIEAVLDLNLKDPTSFADFGGIRRVSSANIEFIEPSRLRDRGFSVLTSWQLARNDYFMAYLEFKKIHMLDGVAGVAVGNVILYGRPFFRDKSSSPGMTIYTYLCRRTSTGWSAQRIRAPEVKHQTLRAETQQVVGREPR